MKEHTEMYSYIKNKEIRVVAYLLGKVNQNLMSIYQQFCSFVEIKEYDYSKYPDYFNNHIQYRWKPLLVAEHLQDHDVVFWFDTSIIFRNGNETLKVKL